MLDLKTHNGGISHHLDILEQSEITSTKKLEVNLRGSGMNLAKFVSESGLYKLIMRSNKPQAKPFQNWVTQVVLPSIRKDGGYVMGEEKVVSGEMTEDAFILKAMQAIKSDLRLWLSQLKDSPQRRPVRVEETAMALRT